MKIEKIVQFETCLDHLAGEELGQALEALNAMKEVLDAIYLGGVGKKNRPAGLLQVLCAPEDDATVRDAIFRHTHALGLRRQIIERYILPRFAATVDIENEKIAAKAHELENRIYIRPEADELAKLAKKKGVGTPGLRFLKKDG